MRLISPLYHHPSDLVATARRRSYAVHWVGPRLQPPALPALRMVFQPNVNRVRDGTGPSKSARGDLGINWAAFQLGVEFILEESHVVYPIEVEQHAGGVHP